MAHRSDARVSTPRGTAHRSLLALALGLPLVLFALGRLVEPDPRGYGTHEQLGLPACPVRALLGIPCPGCGATTALSLLAHGRFGESATLHPFAFTLGILAPVMALLAVGFHVRGRDLAQDLAGLPPRTLAVVAAILFALAWAWNLARAP